MSDSQKVTSRGQNSSVSRTSSRDPKESAAAKVNVIRSSMTIALGTMSSRVLGFIRGALLIAVLGAVGVQDSFQVANNLPNLMYGLLAGSVISAVLLPEIVRAFNREDGGQTHVNRILTFTFVALGAITLTLTVFANVVVYLTAPYLSSAVLKLSIIWSYWFMPQMFFYGMQAVLGQVLNARGHFWEAAWSPVLNNVISILGLLYYVYLFGWAPKGYSDPSNFTHTQMLVIAIPTTLGIVAQGVSLIWPLHKLGFRFRLTWGLRGHGLGRPFRVAVWTLLSATTYMVSTLVVQVVASAAEAYGYNHGIIVPGPAARANATFIYMLPHSVVTASVATAFFAKISAFATSDDGVSVRRLLQIYLHRIVQITMFFTVCLVVFAVPIFQAFAASRGIGEIAAYASVLRAYAPSLVFMALFIVEVDVLLSYGKAQKAFYGYLLKAVVLLLACLLTSFLTVAANWVIWTAAAESFSYLFGSLILFAIVDKMLPGRTDSTLVRNLLGTLIAAVPTALIGAIFIDLAGQFTVGSYGYVLGSSFLKCALGGTLCLSVYLIMLWAVGDRDIFQQAGKMLSRFLPGPLKRKLVRS
ncbi:hypothetical protein KRX54_01965 [Actinomycetaceae bacterium TAE3-ERU4]|nr:hypothetical protein [Actinomycetaceae bacterium TAE3-ERU4]